MNPTIVRTSSKEVKEFNEKNSVAIAAGLFPPQELHPVVVARELRDEAYLLERQKADKLEAESKAIFIAANENAAAKHGLLVRGIYLSQIQSNDRHLGYPLLGYKVEMGGGINASRKFMLSAKNLHTNVESFFHSVYSSIAADLETSKKTTEALAAATAALGDNISKRIHTYAKRKGYNDCQIELVNDRFIVTSQVWSTFEKGYRKQHLVTYTGLTAKQWIEYIDLEDSFEALKTEHAAKLNTIVKGETYANS